MDRFKTINHIFVLLAVFLSCPSFCSNVEIKQLEVAIEEIQSACDKHLNLNSKIREIVKQKNEYEEKLRHIEVEETGIFQSRLSNALNFAIEKSELENKTKKLKEKCEEKKSNYDEKQKDLDIVITALQHQNQNRKSIVPDSKYFQNIERLKNKKSKLESEKQKIDIGFEKCKEKMHSKIDELKVEKYKFTETLGVKMKELKSQNSKTIEKDNELSDQKWKLLYKQRKLSKLSLQKEMEFKEIQENIENIWKDKFPKQKKKFDSAIKKIYKCFAYIFAISLDGKILTAEEETNLQNNVTILLESLSWLKKIILFQDL